MHGLKRILGLWPYLPTFRVAAELEHVSRAAERLGVTPSSVSRALTDLEQAAQVSLFVRDGRSVVLSPAGSALLEAVRKAMRTIDEGLAASRGASLTGPLRVAAVEPFVSVYAATTFATLREQRPEIVPVLSRTTDSMGVTALLDGSVDVMVRRSAPVEPQVTSQLLIEVETGVFAKAHVDAASLPRIDVALGPNVPAPWPSNTRRTALVVTDFDIALKACEEGAGVAALPTMLAAPSVRRGQLVRLDERTSALALYLVTRSSIDEPTVSTLFVEAAREACRLPAD